MSDVAYQRLILCSSIGVGLFLWGILIALTSPRRWSTQLATVGVGLGAVGLGVVVFAPQQWMIVPATAVVALLAVSRVRIALSYVLSPRLLGTSAAVLALGILAYEGWRYDRVTEMESNSAFELAMGELPPDTREAQILVKTDRGTKIAVCEPVEPRSRVEATERERTAAAVNNYSGRWIRRATADDRSNCHGWVFAAGRYNLAGRHVITILSENGYVKVSEPKAGDVCVYTDRSGEVTHSGLVRGVLDDATVMVESKWGRLGVYLHAVGDSCYGTNFTYYRTDRGRHTLAGLEPVTEPKYSAPVTLATPGP